MNFEPDSPDAQPTTSAPRTYTVAQLAEILQLKPATIRANARAGVWPYRAFGPRTIRFTDEDLETILSTAKAPSTKPLQTRRRRKSQ